MTPIRLFVITLIISLLPGMLFAQSIRPLSAEKKAEVERLQEIVTLSKDRRNLENAISSLNKIAFIYWENGNPNQAIDYFLQAVPLNEQVGNQDNIKTIYSNIGLIYTDLEELDPALEYFRKSLQVRRDIGEPREITSGLIDVAYIMGLMGDYREANEHLDEALQISLEHEYSRMTVNIYNLLARNYDKIGNVKKSNEYRQKYASYQEHLETQTIKEEYEEQQEKSEAELRRSRLERQAEQAQYELEQIRYQRRQDSIQEVVQEKQDSLMHARTLDSLKQLKLKEQEQQMEIQDAQLARQQARQRAQRMIIYSAAGGLILGVILLVVMYRSNRQRKRANKALEEKNTEIEKKSDQLQQAFNKIEDQNIKITQSITYAQEIQKALFPPKKNLKKYIAESFIFFKPVDLVSGDFYWFREIEGQPELQMSQADQAPVRSSEPSNGQEVATLNHNKFVLSAVDCTGHGVPGAFMSMIGYNLLDEITQNGVSKPGKILMELHNGIRRTLKQEETNNRDGMDLSVCVIDKQEETVEFSGAKNPLIYIRDGKANVIKGDRVPVGGVQTEKERNFTETSIQVDQPTWFYIFSDGYIDQFGGPNNRKFLMKNLKKLLLEIHKRPMPEQEKILGEKLDEWMGESENQIDDVLVIGFKLEPNHR